MEIFPGIFRIQTPIPDNPAGMLNAYLIRGTEGTLLVDTGWNSAAAMQALIVGLAECGSSLKSLDLVLTTHIHPDHFGLVSQIDGRSRTVLVMQRQDYSLLSLRSRKEDEVALQMAEWLTMNGLPVEGKDLMEAGTLQELGLHPPGMPIRLVDGGEKVRLGNFTFELIWTPGHSPGHLCLYAQDQGLLLCGDHVLAGIIPNISLHRPAKRSPLGDHLRSLEHVEGLEVKLALPGHGEPWTDLRGRARETIAHHEQRLEALVAVLESGPHTALEAAKDLRGNRKGGDWQRLPPLHQRWALSGTLAYLEHLREQGRVQRGLDQGIYHYYL
jgi:glyoxylase-like metal-dependent hydrolase (beta-lactamase superfamily II)